MVPFLSAVPVTSGIRIAMSDSGNTAPDSARSGGPSRSAVESFIRVVYRQRFGARVPGFMPRLLSRHSGDERVLAAVGYRVAQEPLFLEQYLDAPVETLIAAHAAVPPCRDQIAEVGHLASRVCGEGRHLMLDLALQLEGLGIRWVVCTITEELGHLFTRMGLTPLHLGYADPQRLGAAAADWGSYYTHHPAVVAGHLPSALETLRQQGLLAKGDA